MSSRPEMIQNARQQLQKKNIPVEEQEKFLSLLELLTASVGDSILENEDFATLLVETALEQGNLVTIIEQQAAELDALKRITFNLTSSLDLQAVLDAVVMEAMRLVKGAHEAHIYLYRNNVLTFAAALDEYGTKNQQESTPRPFGLTHTVAAQKQTVVVEDMAQHPLFQGAVKPWSGSIIGIPLKIGGEVVGIMNLIRSRKGGFSLSEIRLLSLLADQAALAINNAYFHATVTRMARSDALTNLPNRRALDERLEEEITRSKRHGRPFGVVMMDLDGFKAINDTYGHESGDKVLRQIATALANSLRATDFLARYGGDEMTLLLPETDLSGTLLVVRKLQERLRHLSLSLPDGKTTLLGFSGGVAIFPQHGGTAANLLRAADEALYRAKKHARGACLVARKPTGELTRPVNPSRPEG